MIGRLLTTSIATGTRRPVISHRLRRITGRRLGRGASVTLLLPPVLTYRGVSVLLDTLKVGWNRTYHHTEESKLRVCPGSRRGAARSAD